MPSLRERFRRGRDPGDDARPKALVDDQAEAEADQADQADQAEAEQAEHAEQAEQAEDGTAAPTTDGAAQPAARPRRRRPLPSAGALRRERRVLLRDRDDRIRDLGGLVLEMYRQDRFRQDLVYEQAADVVAIEERLFQVDQLLALASSRGRAAPAQQCPHCGAPVFPGARFCASCGNALAPAQP